MPAQSPDDKQVVLQHHGKAHQHAAEEHHSAERVSKAISPLNSQRRGSGFGGRGRRSCTGGGSEARLERAGASGSVCSCH